MSEDIEYVLLNKKECMAYNVPPATSATGYKAADWSNCIWKGRVQVCAKADILVIKLLDASSGAIFAACPISPNQSLEQVFERTLDSSRYFVLTMSDKTGTRKAYLGVGFDDRNDAFDFNACIQDFRRQTISSPTRMKVVDPMKVGQEELGHGSVSQPPQSTTHDLSLKEGQKISLKLNALKPPASGRVSVPDQPFSVLLPPPPVARSRQEHPVSASSQEPSVDLLDLGIGSAANTSVPTKRSPLKKTAAPVDSLLDF